jgi:integrase
MKLTTTSIRSLSLPAGVSEKTFFDDDVAGFGVRVRSSGSKTWVVQYKIGARHRRMPIGSVDAIDLGKARATAKDLLAAVRLGRDPFGEKLENRSRIGETFGELARKYLTHPDHQNRWKPRSRLEVERHLFTHARPLHQRPVHAVDRRAIADLLTSISASSGLVARNRVRASLSGCFTWAWREGLVEGNPVTATNKAGENKPSDRVLGPDEIRAIDQYSAIIKLLALTGARRQEIGGLRWCEVNFEAALITLRPERTKSGEPREIPLTEPALAVLEAQTCRQLPDGNPRNFVFGRGDSGYSGWSKSKVELDQRIAAARVAAGDDSPMLEWHLHDWRRTLSTVMHNDLGVLPHIVESVLGHVGHRAGVAGVYNRATYAPQKAAALARWADHLMAIVEDQPSKVVPMRERRG